MGCKWFFFGSFKLWNAKRAENVGSRSSENNFPTFFWWFPPTVKSRYSTTRTIHLIHLFLEWSWLYRNLLGWWTPCVPGPFCCFDCGYRDHWPYRSCHGHIHGPNHPEATMHVFEAKMDKQFWYFWWHSSRSSQTQIKKTTNTPIGKGMVFFSFLNKRTCRNNPNDLSINRVSICVEWSAISL